MYVGVSSVMVPLGEIKVAGSGTAPEAAIAPSSRPIVTTTVNRRTGSLRFTIFPPLLKDLFAMLKGLVKSYLRFHTDTDATVTVASI